jgi:hypothetical protein
MALPGDLQDMLYRLKATLPARWFQGATPILDGVLNGLANNWTQLFALLNFTRRQTRLATATDSFLDGISHDVLGSRLPRRITEPDALYRRRIAKEIVRERGTRTAVIAALVDLTGRAPIVFEPTRPADTGAWNGPLGYGAAGGWGSLMLPYQCFVTAYRATGSGIASVAGYGVAAGGYGLGAIEYAGLSMLTGQVTDTDISRAITGVMPTATIAWTRIAN